MDLQAASHVFNFVFGNLGGVKGTQSPGQAGPRPEPRRQVWHPDEGYPGFPYYLISPGDTTLYSLGPVLLITHFDFAYSSDLELRRPFGQLSCCLMRRQKTVGLRRWLGKLMR